MSSEASCTDTPPTRTVPWLGRSIPPMTWSKVDLPLPDLPRMATSSPDPMSRSMSRSAGQVPAGAG